MELLRHNNFYSILLKKNNKKIYIDLIKKKNKIIVKFNFEFICNEYDLEIIENNIKNFFNSLNLTYYFLFDYDNIVKNIQIILNYKFKSEYEFYNLVENIKKVFLETNK